MISSPDSSWYVTTLQSRLSRSSVSTSILLNRPFGFQLMYNRVPRFSTFKSPSV